MNWRIRPAGSLPKENYPALRQFYQTVRSEDEQQIMLQLDGTAAAN